MLFTRRKSGFAGGINRFPLVLMADRQGRTEDATKNSYSLRAKSHGFHCYTFVTRPSRDISVRLRLLEVYWLFNNFLAQAVMVDNQITFLVISAERKPNALAFAFFVFARLCFNPRILSQDFELTGCLI